MNRFNACKDDRNDNRFDTYHLSAPAPFASAPAGPRSTGPVGRGQKHAHTALRGAMTARTRVLARLSSLNAAMPTTPHGRTPVRLPKSRYGNTVAGVAVPCMAPHRALCAPKQAPRAASTASPGCVRAGSPRCPPAPAVAAWRGPRPRSVPRRKSLAAPPGGSSMGRGSQAESCTSACPRGPRPLPSPTRAG